MKCGNCSEESKRGEIEVDALHRVEGSSDPDDLQMVVGITCSRCGTAGAVVLAYGPNASEEDAEFLAELDLDDVTDPVAAETD